MLQELKIPVDLLEELGRPGDSELYQGSMGIYVFNRKILIDALNNDHDDFGKHIVPLSLQKHQVFAYIFQDYWEDIGTVRAFFEANLALTETDAPFDFFDFANPVYTHPRFLAASKVIGTKIGRAIIADGCVVIDANIDRAVIGLRSMIGKGSTIRNTVMMGADFYQNQAFRQNQDGPPLGIGANCVIEGTIIDKNARIGDNVVITPKGKPTDLDGKNYYIRDGVVVIPKGAVVASGTSI
ncbi:MAG: glucose-1-phosphate adenylyltransferase, partial [Verrucomicrobia bacterium]|nr:glucose-1-phosphate adenylyltransferase [Verrucomicrobiota bacterium]